MLSLNDDTNALNKVKSNYATYSKLSLLAKQVNLIHEEARYY